MSDAKTLFYDLYSKSNNRASAGYICTSAIDETQTSFDITANSGGSAGVITDSNGNTLSSINMTEIHAEGLTQYNTETRILQPYTCCLLQGQEYGLARATYNYIIPDVIASVKNYQKFVSVDFDIIYNNFKPYVLHVHTEVDGETSYIDAINDILSDNDIEVSVQRQEIKEADGCIVEYLVFMSQKEGMFYYINNLKMMPMFKSEEYPRSPFSKSLSGMRTIIYKFIEQYHPVKKGVTYDESTYEVDCDFYRWLLTNYQDAVDNLEKFKKALDYLGQIREDMPEIEKDMLIEKANVLIYGTAYDHNIINSYDLANMRIIADIVESLKAFINETKDYFQEIYWLVENRGRRIPMMKYPNGAFRGIVVIPDWPTNVDYSNQSLMVNHIQSLVKLYRPVRYGLYEPKIYGVLSNATIMAEKDMYKAVTGDPMNGIQSNCAMCTHIEDGWNDNLSTDYMDPYRPDKSIYEDTVFMGQNCYAHSKNIIGLYRYMQYVNEHNLWNKIGEAYMVIGNEDDVQNQTRNLPTSVLIYNPNPEPVRIKYMIFS